MHTEPWKWTDTEGAATVCGIKAKTIYQDISVYKLHFLIQNHYFPERQNADWSLNTPQVHNVTDLTLRSKFHSSSLTFQVIFPEERQLRNK